MTWGRKDAAQYIASHDFHRHLLGVRYALMVADYTSTATDELDETAWSDYDHLDLGGACSLAAQLVTEHLVVKGYDAVMAIGTYDNGWHCWTVCADHIIDVTATQFAWNSPQIVIVPAAADHHYDTHLILDVRDGNTIKEAVEDQQILALTPPLRQALLRHWPDLTEPESE